MPSANDIRLPLVYIVILNWCSAKDTRECIQSILNSNYPNYKILLIDNGSPDGSGPILHEQFPQLEFISTGKNLGFAGGNNKAIRHVHAVSEAQFVWIVNPDVRVGHNTLSLLIDLMLQNSSIGVAGPRLLHGAPGCQEEITGLHFPEYQKFKNVFQGVSLSADVIDADYMMGCSMLIRMELFKAAGLIREDFFLYAEEAEFQLRARSLGWRTVIFRKAVDSHLWELSKKSQKDHKYYARNLLLLARIQKEFIFSTLWSLCDGPRISSSFKRGAFTEAFWFISRIKWRAIFEGLFLPIRRIPHL